MLMSSGRQKTATASAAQSQRDQPAAVREGALLRTCGVATATRSITSSIPGIGHSPARRTPTRGAQSLLHRGNRQPMSESGAGARCAAHLALDSRKAAAQVFVETGIADAP